MELKTLVESTVELFGIDSPEELGGVLINASSDREKMSTFVEMVGGDLTKDWLQMIFQYYSADRKEKMQDFTPKSLARFVGMLAGESKHIVDMCAGSGALIIQKWAQDPETKFTALEFDESVIPFLIFNMVVRNIECRILHADALTGEMFSEWKVKKGDDFGDIVHIEPAIQS